MKLSILLKFLKQYKISDKSDIDIAGISEDSRKITEGFLFVAVPGLTVDGHNFIELAAKNGAKVVVGERNRKDLNIKKDIVYIQVENSRKALAYLASAFYKNPSQKLKIIGVTGTKGKTTTVHLIHHILESLGQKVGLVSSIKAKINDKEFDTGFHVTNPDPVSLNELLNKMVNSGCKYAVIEVSSHGIDQHRVTGINFEVGVLTNIEPEHLDYHKTFENYKKTKMSFIKSASQKVIAPKNTKLNVLPGKFNNLNVEAAISAVEYLGFERKKALSTLETFVLPEGRMMTVDNNKGLNIIIDFAHNPSSLEALLTHLSKLKTNDSPSQKLIAIFGCASERDESKRPVMGEISTRFADMSIFTAEDPRREDINKILREIEKGVNKSKTEYFEAMDYDDSTTMPVISPRSNNKIVAGGKKHIYFKIPERGEAITFAIDKLAKKGDIVVLCGKGHEKSMAYDGVEYPWSDQKAVEYALKGEVLEIKRPQL